MTAPAVRTSLVARSTLGYASAGLDHMDQQWERVLVQKNPEKTNSGLLGLHGLLILHLIQNACVGRPRRQTSGARAAERSLELSKTMWSKWAKRSMGSKRCQPRPRRPPGEQK
jgi:hypothetical protein